MKIIRFILLVVVAIPVVALANLRALAPAEVPKSLQTTTADMDLFVCGHNNPDAGGGTPNPCTVVGNDGNACTTLATPCQTIQGGIDHVPRLFRHNVVVNVGPGNYRGAIVSGFRSEVLWDAGTPNDFGRRSAFVIQGTLALAASGNDGGALGDTPTGTCGGGVTTPCATNQVIGPTTDFAHATFTAESTKTWAVGILRGKFLEVTSTAGTVVQQYPIVDNTATVITVPTWNTLGVAGVLPTIASTYRILDHATNVNTAVVTNLTGGIPFDLTGSAAVPPASNFNGRLGFMFMNDDGVGRAFGPFFGLDKIRISGADISGSAVYLVSGSVYVNRSRLETNNGLGQISMFASGGRHLELNQNYFTTNATGVFVNAAATVGGVGGVSMGVNVFDGCGAGCVRGNSVGRFILAGADFRIGASASATWQPIRLSETFTAITNSKIDCTAPSSRTAIDITGGAGNRSQIVALLSGLTISNCNVVANVNGYGHVISGANRNSGTGNTTVYSLTNGAIVEADRLDGVTAHDTITSTIATNEVVIDTDRAYSFADINAMSPDGGVLHKNVFDLRSGTLVRQTPQ
jgi:hypothetical protein